MKYLYTLLIAALIVAGPARSESNNSFYSRGSFLPATPSAYNDGLVGFINPANLGMLHRWESRFYWSTEGDKLGSFENWGFFTGHGLGFGVQHQVMGQYSVNDFSLGLGFGDDAGAFGISYGWSTGDDEQLGRENILTVAGIKRPLKFLSLGLSGRISTESKWNEMVGEAGVRPFGTSFLTLFGDASWPYRTRFEDIVWSAGAAVEVVPGINLFGRYFENESFTAGLAINFGISGVSGQAHYDNDQELSHYNHSVRLGEMKKSIFQDIFDTGPRFVPFYLKGRVTYNKYKYFDSGKIRFFELIKAIRAAVADPRVEALVFNISQLSVSAERAWEIREELLRARERGIKVIMFAERVGMTGYHLASVADYIVLDPQGAVVIPGYVLSRSYYKAALDKLGIGFDEWRFMKYKSYLEGYARKSMSDPEYEQLQTFVDDWYETVRGEISESRGFTNDQFDHLVDSIVYFLPNKALEYNLVDTLARWSDAGQIVRGFMKNNIRGLAPSMTYGRAIASPTWGPKPQIAIVYGLGECAMNSGIRARMLGRVFEWLAENNRVKAVVFRVDSPGGDGMASDVIAEALRKCAKKKPVIVSQGSVAASGGYWISMYADTILAGPYTVTGSIGVIGGWIYDNGLGQKAGISYDYAARGEHVNLLAGISLPFTRLNLPGRNLTDDERKEAEQRILALYEEFMEKVAEGRDLPIDSVRAIAQGRSWSGIDAEQNGLIDRLGGMMDAIAIARSMTTLPADAEIDYLEIPKYKGAFDMGHLIDRQLPVGIDADPLYRYLKLYSEDPWRPLFMLPPGTYPDSDMTPDN